MLVEDMDPRWSETGDRYLLKLLRDYMFHQVYEDGSPVIDLAHAVECLNKVYFSLSLFFIFFFSFLYFILVHLCIFLVLIVGFISWTLARRRRYCSCQGMSKQCLLSGKTLYILLYNIHIFN